MTCLAGVVTDYGQWQGDRIQNGKEADARNCILILTTNLGAPEAEKNNIGFMEDFEKEYEDGALKKYFAPRV